MSEHSAQGDEAAAEIARLRAEAAAARGAGWRAGRDAGAAMVKQTARSLRAVGLMMEVGERRTVSLLMADALDDTEEAIRAIPEPKEPTDA